MHMKCFVIHKIGNLMIFKNVKIVIKNFHSLLDSIIVDVVDWYFVLNV